MPRAAFHFFRALRFQFSLEGCTLAFASRRTLAGAASRGLATLCASRPIDASCAAALYDTVAATIARL